MKKIVSVLLAALLLTLTTAALAEDLEKFSIGASAAPHAEILEFIKPMMEEKGFDMEIAVFNDYILPNSGVEKGDLQANFFQHSLYLFDFNANNDTHLVPVIPTHYEPMGVYKGKTTDLADLPDGAVIGVPNDPTNEARALNVLAAMGLIELSPDAGLLATKLDIVSSEKNLEIKELEAAMLPQMLADLDLAVINGNYALDAGLSLTEDTVGMEDAETAVAAGYVNFVVVKEGNEDAPFVAALREAINDETTVEFMTERYSDTSVLALDAEIPTAE